MQARHAATVLTLAVMMLLALVGPSSAEPRVVDLAIRKRELPKEQRVVRSGKATTSR